MIKAMGDYCGFDVTVIQANWEDCWGNNEIGAGLREGWYHACMLYSHPVGVRNRYLEFSNSYNTLNKPAGLLTRLVNGAPQVNGRSNLSGLTIVDVTGWAPTADTLNFVMNRCTNSAFATDFTIIQGNDQEDHTGNGAYTHASKGNNDKALLVMLNGLADAVYIYADQAYNYQCPPGSTADTQAGWNCELWNLWGTDFAYVQTGLIGYLYNGTTVTISKKGNGIAQVMDDCLERFLPTREFYEVCAAMHGYPAVNQIKQCIPNSYFNDHPDFEPYDIDKNTYIFPTNELLAGGKTCSDGYCNCDE